MGIIIENQIIQQQDRQIQLIIVLRLVQQRLQLDLRHHRRHVLRLDQQRHQLDLRHHRRHVLRLDQQRHQLRPTSPSTTRPTTRPTTPSTRPNHRQLDLRHHRQHVLCLRLQDQKILELLHIIQLQGNLLKEINRIAKFRIYKKSQFINKLALFYYIRIPGGSNSL